MPAMIRYGNREAAIPSLVLGIWAADNGCYAAPDRFSLAGYIGWLHDMGAHHGTPLFATAPDVVGDAQATLNLSLPTFEWIREVAPAALVAQDGLENLDIPWDDFDVLFVGGTTDWKLGEAAAAIVAEAKHRGMWVHMGRVNSHRRTVYAESIGCDSVDGTYLRFRPYGRPDLWADHANANPSIWRET